MKTNPNALRTLTPRQISWCKANGIAIDKDDRGFGFFFSKGDTWIEPVSVTDSTVYVMEVDRSEDGDGARSVENFAHLRDALRFLAAR